MMLWMTCDALETKKLLGRHLLIVLTEIEAGIEGRQ